MELCKNLSIPLEHHEFYKNLPVASVKNSKETEKIDDFEKDEEEESIIIDSIELEEELIKTKKITLKEKTSNKKSRKVKNIKQPAQEKTKKTRKVVASQKKTGNPTANKRNKK